MSFETTISFLLEAGIVMMVLYFYYLLFWKNSSAYNTRRAILMAIPLIALVIPALSFNIQLDISAIPTFDLQEVVFSNAVATPSAPELTVLDFSLLAYGTGLAISLLIWFYNLSGVLRIVEKGNKKMKLMDGYWLIQTEGKMPTFSFFNLLFWNEREDLNDVESEMILQHELTHIRHFHSLDILIISIFKTIFWFVPVIHWMEKELALVHEFVADEQASKEFERHEYIQLLANQTLYNMKHQWIKSFNKGPLFKRLEALEKQSIFHARGRILISIPLVAALILAFSCESNSSMETADESGANVEKVLSQVDEMPQFVGGMEAMIAFLTENVKYPESAKKSGAEGKVLVQFVVDKDGSILNAEVLEGFDEECDNEALRVVKAMPKWEAGKIEGKTVKTKMTLPIAFALVD